MRREVTSFGAEGAALTLVRRPGPILEGGLRHRGRSARHLARLPTTMHALTADYWAGSSHSRNAVAVLDGHSTAAYFTSTGSTAPRCVTCERSGTLDRPSLQNSLDYANGSYIRPMQGFERVPPAVQPSACVVSRTKKGVPSEQQRRPLETGGTWACSAAVQHGRRH